jgi:biotin transport system ATP-binding protein
VKAIEMKNLTHRFEDATIGLDGINLSVEEGEFVIVTGKNGSGKTVLARHMNGLLRPTEGSVKIRGRDIGDHLLETRKTVGLIFQDVDSQIVGETVEEDIAFGLRNLGCPPEEIAGRVERVMKQFDLIPLARQPCHLLSGGEKQRLALAGVLVMEPRIVVMDEPFSSLDYPAALRLQTYLRRLSAQNHTLVIIAHDLAKVLSLADRVVVLESGRIVLDGRPGEVLGMLERYGVEKPSEAESQVP